MVGKFSNECLAVDKGEGLVEGHKATEAVVNPEGLNDGAGVR